MRLMITSNKEKIYKNYLNNFLFSPFFNHPDIYLLPIII